MQKQSFICLVFCFLLFCTVQLYAPQDDIAVSVTVNEICSIGFSSTATLTLNLLPPTVAGGIPAVNTDSSKLLQYSSLVPSGVVRTITANWDSIDTAPAGTTLSLEATNIPSGCGSESSELTLSPTSQTLITNIGGCNTGTGTNGVTLAYRFSVNNMTQLAAGTFETVTITFTLTDAT